MFKIIWKILFPTYTGKGYTTVRYAFPVIFVAAILASIASLISGTSSYVTIKTDSDLVAKDEQFYIDVSVSAHVAVNAVDLVISYPVDQMTIDGIDKGTSVLTIWTEEPYFKDGKIYLRGGTFRKGFVGEHTIARIKAHATKEGDAKIVVTQTQLLAGDGKGTVVPVSDSSSFNEVRIAVQGENGTIKAKAGIAVVSDVDGDGDVDIKDVSIFMSAWLTKSTVFDFNNDGRMTFTDFSIILAQSFKG